MCWWVAAYTPSLSAQHHHPCELRWRVGLQIAWQVCVAVGCWRQAPAQVSTCGAQQGAAPLCVTSGPGREPCAGHAASWCTFIKVGPARTRCNSVKHWLWAVVLLVGG